MVPIFLSVLCQQPWAWHVSLWSLIRIVLCVRASCYMAWYCHCEVLLHRHSQDWWPGWNYLHRTINLDKLASGVLLTSGLWSVREGKSDCAGNIDYWKYDVYAPNMFNAVSTSLCPKIWRSIFCLHFWLWSKFRNKCSCTSYFVFVILAGYQEQALKGTYARLREGGYAGRTS